MAEEPPAGPQLVVVYELKGTVIPYATAYSDFECGEALEDCRAKHGNAKLMIAEDLFDPHP